MPPPADPLRVDSPPAVAHLATSGMHVTKRDGRRQPVSFDKILQRLYDNSEGLEHVDIVLVAQKTIAGLYDGVTTASLDMLAAETAAYLSTTHPQYSSLAARIGRPGRRQAQGRLRRLPRAVARGHLRLPRPARRTTARRRRARATSSTRCGSPTSS